ncbi:hypothetical protein M0802_003709 [Mischocyttarus mexicanus]|nr:hypothetical protein M0802_003709 [Mischocyttarus mexicanus]
MVACIDDTEKLEMSFLVEHYDTTIITTTTTTTTTTTIIDTHEIKLFFVLCSLFAVYLHVVLNCGSLATYTTFSLVGWLVGWLVAVAVAVTAAVAVAAAVTAGIVIVVVVVAVRQKF